jgi:hypothetical protein
MSGDRPNEYEEVCNSVRHWENMRFAQLTLFLAGTAGLGSAFGQPPIAGSTDQLARTGLSCMAFLFVAIFWAMDERVVAYWKAYRLRATELEHALGFQQHSRAPQRGWFTSQNAVRLLFAMLATAWTVVLVRGL